MGHGRGPMAVRQLRVEGAGNGWLNGLYLPKPAAEVPAGFRRTCEAQGWDTAELWDQLANPAAGKPWWEKADDSYIYFNFGDNLWWVDEPSGAGVYVAPGGGGAPTSCPRPRGGGCSRGPPGRPPPCGPSRRPSCRAGERVVDDESSKPGGAALRQVPP